MKQQIKRQKFDRTEAGFETERVGDIDFAGLQGGVEFGGEMAVELACEGGFEGQGTVNFVAGWIGLIGTAGEDGTRFKSPRVA